MVKIIGLEVNALCWILNLKMGKYGCGVAHYSDSSLIRRFVIANTQISYTWRFVNPNICSVVPMVRYSEGSFIRKMK